MIYEEVNKLVVEREYFLFQLADELKRPISEVRQWDDNELDQWRLYFEEKERRWQKNQPTNKAMRHSESEEDN